MGVSCHGSSGVEAISCFERGASQSCMEQCVIHKFDCYQVFIPSIEQRVQVVFQGVEDGPVGPFSQALGLQVKGSGSTD